jgi:hypothetical protein
MAGDLQFVGGVRMIFIDRNPNGSFTVSAEVSDSDTPFTWFERLTLYGYKKSELRKQFLEHLSNSNLTLIK